jgi:putative flavoprotein involved in K+ transport
VGCAEYISSGEIKVKSGAEIQSFSENTIFLTDGSTLEADIVIFACV